MAFRSSTTLKKRQKEMARMEKQRDKAARKVQRKLAGKQPEDELEVLDAPYAGDESEASDAVPESGSAGVQEEGRG